MEYFPNRRILLFIDSNSYVKFVSKKCQIIENKFMEKLSDK